jgi:hypothetical protein
MLLSSVELLCNFLEKTSSLPNEILSVVTAMKNIASASTWFFSFEQLPWVGVEMLTCSAK